MIQEPTRQDPTALIETIASEFPSGVLDNIILVGSLAAAHSFAKKVHDGTVTTKDADLLLEPRGAGLVCSVEIATKLLDDGWTPRYLDHQPQTDREPVDRLPVIRLYPPGSNDYFVELLVVPDAGDDTSPAYHPVELPGGWHSVPSFEFMGVTCHDPIRLDSGIRIARPATMALANLLAHPTIRPGTMSQLYVGRKIKRSNKDLGRVLALAGLGGDEEIENWASSWITALQEQLPGREQELAARLGDGLAALLASDADLEEAWITCDVGLLNGLGSNPRSLRALGRRVLADAVEPVASHFDTGD